MNDTMASSATVTHAMQATSEAQLEHLKASADDALRAKISASSRPVSGAPASTALQSHARDAPATAAMVERLYEFKLQQLAEAEQIHCCAKCGELHAAAAAQQLPCAPVSTCAPFSALRFVDSVFAEAPRHYSAPVTQMLLGHGELAYAIAKCLPLMSP